MSLHDPPALSPRVLDEIYAHARAEFPRECCGYVLGHGDEARAVPCDNRQDEHHRANPRQRTAETGFDFHKADLQAMRRSVGSPQPITVIYHSHPRVGAFFSEMDRRGAIVAGLRVDHLVVDVQEGGVPGAVLFRMVGNRPREIAVYGDPGRGNADLCRR